MNALFKSVIFIIAFSNVAHAQVTRASLKIIDNGNCEHRATASTTGKPKTNGQGYLTVDFVAGDFGGSGVKATFDPSNGTRTIAVHKDKPAVDHGDYLIAGSEHNAENAWIVTRTNLKRAVCEELPSCGPEPSPFRLTSPQNADVPECQSPILIDLAGDGLNVGGVESAVYWDTYNSGHPALIQWVEMGTDDAFLALDHNGNGLVDNGSELFGDGTPLLSDETDFAPNGFVALGEYDLPQYGGNNDGQITVQDRVWQDLKLWLDSDADAVCQAHEVYDLTKMGFSNLKMVPFGSQHMDEHGNWFRFFASAGVSDGKIQTKHEMVDVFFRRLD